MVDDNTFFVCATDGVDVGTNARGKLVHLDGLPEGTPEHEIAIIGRSLYEEHLVARETLKFAVADLMAHHANLHPVTECPWLLRVDEALKHTT